MAESLVIRATRAQPARRLFECLCIPESRHHVHAMTLYVDTWTEHCTYICWEIVEVTAAGSAGAPTGCAYERGTAESKQVATRGIWSPQLWPRPVDVLCAGSVRSDAEQPTVRSAEVATSSLELHSEAATHHGVQRSAETQNRSTLIQSIFVGEEQKSAFTCFACLSGSL
jgi:hypothetical protein